MALCILLCFRKLLSGFESGRLCARGRTVRFAHSLFRGRFRLFDHGVRSLQRGPRVLQSLFQPLVFGLQDLKPFAFAHVVLLELLFQSRYFGGVHRRALFQSVDLRAKLSLSSFHFADENLLLFGQIHRQ